MAVGFATGGLASALLAWSADLSPWLAVPLGLAIGIATALGIALIR